MSRACLVCGGLVVASGEVLGYGGPICNGLHGASYIAPAPHIEIRLLELEKRLQELSQRLSKTDSQTGGSQNASGDPKRKANT